MNFISNIDTIYILVYISDFEKSSKLILSYLSEEKEKAKLMALSNAPSKHTVTINDLNFTILPNGTAGYAYILHNSGYEVNIAQFNPSISNFSPIRIRISSEYLWAYGIDKTWAKIYNWISETFGNISDDKVSRVDLCSHVSGVDFITNYELSYKGKFKNRENFYTGNTINAITFGSRKQKNIYCRIYNKTLELKTMKNKNWFIPIWENNNMDINNVWNVEFELKSELLRKFNINSVSDVIMHLRDLWQYCTCEWVQKIDRTNNKIERCKVNEDWINIQHNFDIFHSCGLIERNKQLQLDANALVPNIAGNVVSYAAKNNQLNIKDVLLQLFNDIGLYFKNKNTTFEEAVITKKSLL